MKNYLSHIKLKKNDDYKTLYTFVTLHSSSLKLDKAAKELKISDILKTEKPHLWINAIVKNVQIHFIILSTPPNVH